MGSEMCIRDRASALPGSLAAAVWRTVPFSRDMPISLTFGASLCTAAVVFISLGCSAPGGEPVAAPDCDASSPPTCVSQAVDLKDHGQFSEAVSLLADSCERFHAPSCRALGVWKRDGIQETESIIDSVEMLLIRADSGGDVEGTYQLGVSYRDGLTVEATPSTAAGQFERACRQEHVRACYDLGMLLTQGALPLDADKAGMAFLTGCGLGNGSSCWNVATLAKQGLFTLPDDLTVDGLMERACAQGAEGACGG